MNDLNQLGICFALAILVVGILAICSVLLLPFGVGMLGIGMVLLVAATQGD